MNVFEVETPQHLPQVHSYSLTHYLPGLFFQFVFTVENEWSSFLLLPYITWKQLNGGKSSGFLISFVTLWSLKLAKEKQEIMPLLY